MEEDKSYKEKYFQDKLCPTLLEQAGECHN